VLQNLVLFQLTKVPHQNSKVLKPCAKTDCDKSPYIYISLRRTDGVRFPYNKS